MVLVNESLEDVATSAIDGQEAFVEGGEVTLGCGGDAAAEEEEEDEGEHEEADCGDEVAEWLPIDWIFGLLLDVDSPLNFVL